MINYSFFSKVVHQIALAYLPVRVTELSIEKAFLDKTPGTLDGKHVYIIGMARGGTTALLNTIYETGVFASHTYEDMPFILCPNFWSTIKPKYENTHQQERMHGDNLEISQSSPEAFEEIFWKTFEDEDDEDDLYATFIQAIIKRCGKNRYLCKNNQNIQRLPYLTSILPNSIFLVLFRDPIDHCQSLLNQHRHFLDLEKKEPFIRKYMDWIGHTEFGPTYKPMAYNSLKFNDFFDINHWLEQWESAYRKVFSDFAQHEQVCFLRYESLVPGSESWDKLKKKLEVEEVGNSFRAVRHKEDYPGDQQLVDSSYDLYRSMSEISL